MFSAIVYSLSLIFLRSIFSVKIMEYSLFACFTCNDLHCTMTIIPTTIRCGSFLAFKEIITIFTITVHEDIFYDWRND
jgi:hypothetical protein